MTNLLSTSPSTSDEFAQGVLERIQELRDDALRAWLSFDDMTAYDYDMQADDLEDLL